MTFPRQDNLIPHPAHNENRHRVEHHTTQRADLSTPNWNQIAAWIFWAQLTQPPARRQQPASKPASQPASHAQPATTSQPATARFVREKTGRETTTPMLRGKFGARSSQSEGILGSIGGVVSRSFPGENKRETTPPMAGASRTLGVLFRGLFFREKTGRETTPPIARPSFFGHPPIIF